MDEVQVGDELLVGSEDLPEGEAGNGAGPRGGALVSREEATEYRTRWEGIQATFIDDPRRAVEQADNLVDRVLNTLMERLTEERDGLARRWDTGGDPVSTEDLRVTLKGYRGLLDQLLSVSL